MLFKLRNLYGVEWGRKMDMNTEKVRIWKESNVTYLNVLHRCPLETLSKTTIKSVRITDNLADIRTGYLSNTNLDRNRFN